MKAALRKQLRVQRRALREPDHRHRALAAAKAPACMGVGTMIAPSRSVGGGATGRVRIWSDSRLTTGAQT
jgi:hypothetical protein